MRGLFPSVTEILADVGLAPDLTMVKPEVLAWASARGTALHRAIELHAKGTLDYDSLHPEIVGALKAYLDFVYESGHKAVASEQVACRLKMGTTAGRPQSSLVIEVLLELLSAATVDATPAELAQRLIARDVGATAEQVRQVFERYELGRKKVVRLPRWGL